MPVEVRQGSIASLQRELTEQSENVYENKAQGQKVDKSTGRDVEPWDLDF
jgi:hypothetical protein